MAIIKLSQKDLLEITQEAELATARNADMGEAVVFLESDGTWSIGFPHPITPNTKPLGDD